MDGAGREKWLTVLLADPFMALSSVALAEFHRVAAEHRAACPLNCPSFASWPAVLTYCRGLWAPETLLRCPTSHHALAKHPPASLWYQQASPIGSEFGLLFAT
jgi:hypothetical protein